MSLLPNPLHPAIVHLPIAIAVLAPLFAAGALWAIGRGASARFAWAVPTALLAILLVSGWTALQTGEGDEERVEDTVGRAVIHTHEEAAEAFLVVAGGVLLVAAAGFMAGKTGSIARGVGAAGTLAVLAMGFNVGHTGGKVAYPDATTAPGAASITRGGGESVADDQDDDRTTDSDEDDDRAPASATATAPASNAAPTSANVTR